MGKIACGVCDTAGKVKKYIELKVEFKNHQLSHVIEKTDLPDDLIRGVSGAVEFESSSNFVAPVSGYPNSEINIRSNDFVSRHVYLQNDGRVLQQRHKLQCVPVFECHFKWKDKTGRMWVYGLEHKLFTEDYPQTCCWGCNIL